MCWLQGRWNAKKICCASSICEVDDEELRKAFHLEKGKIVYIELKWNAQGKGIILICFSFYRSYVVSWETGFRIDSRTIKRGSRMSNLIISFRESSNLYILASSYLVV